MANNNRFFPIFEHDGEVSTPPAPRKVKPPRKRVRQKPPSPPQAPLAVEAPPRDPTATTAITSRLDEIGLTMRKYLIRLDAVDRHLKTAARTPENATHTVDRLDTIYGWTNDLEEKLQTYTEKVDTLLLIAKGTWQHRITAEAFADLSKKVDDLLARPAPAGAPASVAVSDPQLVEAIAALSKKVDDVLARSTASPAATVAASATEQTAAIVALSKKVDGLLERPATAPALESRNLAALTKQVTAVSQELTSLTARHSTAAATTAKPARAATAAKSAPAPAKPAPAKPEENVDSAWKPVVSRQTKKRQQIYPPAERLIVVQLAEVPNDAQKAADTALRTVNRALVGHPDVTVPPLYTAYVSRSNALVFTAGPRNRGRDYEPFLGIIRNALAEIPAVSAHVSQQWTRYIMNGIPTATTPEDARETSRCSTQLRSWPTRLDGSTPPRTDRTRPPPPWSSPSSAPSLGTSRWGCSTGNAKCASTSRSAIRRNAADANTLTIPLHSAKPPPPSARSHTSPTSTRATSPATRKDAALRIHRFAVLCASSHTRLRTGLALLSSRSHAARIRSRPRLKNRVRPPRRIRR
jgi:hypothetical protein